MQLHRLPGANVRLQWPGISPQGGLARNHPLSAFECLNALYVYRELLAAFFRRKTVLLKSPAQEQKAGEDCDRQKLSGIATICPFAARCLWRSSRLGQTKSVPNEDVREFALGVGVWRIVIGTRHNDHV